MANTWNKNFQQHEFEFWKYISLQVWCKYLERKRKTADIFQINLVGSATAMGLDAFVKSLFPDDFCIQRSIARPLEITSLSGCEYCSCCSSSLYLHFCIVVHVQAPWAWFHWGLRARKQVCLWGTWLSWGSQDSGVLGQHRCWHLCLPHGTLFSIPCGPPS